MITTERVHQPEIQVEKPKKKGLLTGTRAKIVATGIAATIGLGGLGYLASRGDEGEPNPTQNPRGIVNPTPEPGPFPTPTPEVTPDTSWVNLIPESKFEDPKDVSLAEITQQQGIASMVPNGYAPTAEYPYGYSVSLQQETIVAVEPDTKNNSVWVALALPGDKITKEKTGESATNLDGTKTELYLYKGFTVWVEILDSAVATGTNNQGQQGLSHIAPFLKVGDTISAYININQPKVYQQYQEMNLNTLNQLNESIGEPNNRTDKKFEFKADFVFVNGIVK
ncbi:MAG: hypothetical protein M1450_04970 [Patescibacteria group bacterium]|nr:hypothetical protein [Patescibacteria group bacterium]